MGAWIHRERELHSEGKCVHLACECVLVEEVTKNEEKG